MGARVEGHTPGKSTRQPKDKLSNPAPDGTKSFATPNFAHGHTDKKDRYSDALEKAFLSGHRKELRSAQTEPDENGRFLKRFITSQQDMDIDHPYEKLLSLFDTNWNQVKFPGDDEDDTFVKYVNKQFKDDPEGSKQAAANALTKILKRMSDPEGGIKTQNDIVDNYDLPSLALMSRLAALNSPKASESDPYGTFEPFVNFLKEFKKLPIDPGTGTKLPHGLSIEQAMFGPLFDENNQPMLDEQGNPIIGPLTDIDRYPFSIPQNLADNGYTDDVYDYILSGLDVPMNRSIPLSKEDLERAMDDETGETAGSFVHSPAERMRLLDNVDAIKNTAKYLDTVREGNRKEWQDTADYINNWRDQVPGEMVYNYMLLPALLDGTIDPNSHIADFVGNILNNKFYANNGSQSALSDMEKDLLYGKKLFRIADRNKSSGNTHQDLIRRSLSADDLAGFPFNDPSQWDDFIHGVTAQAQNRLLDIDPSLGEDKFVEDQPLTNQDRKNLPKLLNKLQTVKTVLSDPAALSELQSVMAMSDADRISWLEAHPTLQYAYKQLSSPDNFNAQGRYDEEELDRKIAELNKKLETGKTGKFTKGLKRVESPKFGAAVGPSEFTSISDALSSLLSDKSKGRSTYDFLKEMEKEVQGMEGDSLEEKVNEWLGKNIIYGDDNKPKFESYTDFPSNIDFWNESRDRSHFARGQQLAEGKEDRDEAAKDKIRDSYEDRIKKLFDSGMLTSRKLKALQRSKNKKVLDAESTDPIDSPSISRYIAKAQKGALSEEDFDALMSYLEMEDKRNAALKAGYYSSRPDELYENKDISKLKNDTLRGSAMLRQELRNQYTAARPQYLDDQKHKAWVKGDAQDTVMDAEIQHRRMLDFFKKHYNVDTEKAEQMYQDMAKNELTSKQAEDKELANTPHTPLSALRLLYPLPKYETMNIETKAEREAAQKKANTARLRQNNKDYSNKTDEEIEQAERARKEAEKQEQQAEEAVKKENEKPATKSPHIEAPKNTIGAFHEEKSNKVSENPEKQITTKKKYVVRKKKETADEGSMKNLQGIFNDSMNKGY